MAVVLTVLKIIGIVLLSLIGLLLLLFLLVLFVPIRYRLDFERDDPSGAFCARGSVSYLLHIISASVFYEDEIGYSLKLFGIKIRPGKDKKLVTDDSGHIKETEVRTDSNAEDSIASCESVPDPCDYKIDWNDIKDPDNDEIPTEEAADEGSDADTKEDKKDIFDLIEGIVDKISTKYTGIKEKYYSIRKELRFWDKMIHDERNQSVADLIKRLIIKLIKMIIPKKVKGFVHFGFEDPAVTGKILMYLAIIYPVLPQKLIIDPGFTDTDIYGNLHAKGHFALVFPIIYFIRIYFNKDFKRMLRIYRKHKDR